MRPWFVAVFPEELPLCVFVGRSLSLAPGGNREIGLPEQQHPSEAIPSACADSRGKGTVYYLCDMINWFDLSSINDTHFLEEPKRTSLEITLLSNVSPLC